MTSALAKPQRRGDGLEALAAVLEQRSRRLHPRLLDVVGRRGAELRAEAAGELALGEVDAGGE